MSEEEIAEAMRVLLSATHNLAEGAGAAGLAGLVKLARAAARGEAWGWCCRGGMSIGDAGARAFRGA
ncbi:MAG: hypothetical protein R3F14_41050 [Polyangiaceae bacterium]